MDFIWNPKKEYLDNSRSINKMQSCVELVQSIESGVICDDLIKFLAPHFHLSRVKTISTSKFSEEIDWQIYQWPNLLKHKRQFTGALHLILSKYLGTSLKNIFRLISWNEIRIFFWFLPSKFFIKTILNWIIKCILIKFTKQNLFKFLFFCCRNNSCVKI